ncbi:nucleoside diphosphate kinase regulator [Paracoccus onubensis]|uniref:nucleoside diphosphate kinase regulator n=1 Tax=Paracoccus onubensis TaxID=1675788 RepID=UPI002731CD31|nr:nucleoside diphosphate kinase regulator [Paracoccus onubensis]MDP0927666.1 nucleoside diphosphate kinase regulator [Paracoccus onubensis]
MNHSPPARARAARRVISEDHLDLLERLEAGLVRRNPELSALLLSTLARARIVPADRLPDDVVALGRRVTYLDEDTQVNRHMTLVPPAEADIARDHVSVMTPIGIALIGLPVGAKASWKARNNESRRLRLLEVERREDRSR